MVGRFGLTNVTPVVGSTATAEFQAVTQRCTRVVNANVYAGAASG